jgi:hypothetical protein
MSLLDYLRRAQIQLSGPLGEWAQKVSLDLDAVAEAYDITFPTLRLSPTVPPTIVEAGPTLGYLFVPGPPGNYLYAESPFHPRVDRSKSVIIGLGWAPAASEVGRTATWSLSIGLEKTGALVTAIDLTKTLSDLAVPAVAATYQRSAFVLSAAEWAADPDTDEMHIRITRLASTGVEATLPGVHHLAVIQPLVARP